MRLILVHNRYISRRAGVEKRARTVTLMDTLTLLGIITGIYILIYIIAQVIGPERFSERGIEAGTPFFIMFKTERLNAFLTCLGKKTPRVFFYIGILVGFGGMIFAFWMLADNLMKFFFVPSSAGGVVPIIPGVTVTGLPLIYIMIGLAITLVTHEFAHGIASARDDIPIRSSGLFFFLVLFGGFVEPDEEVFEKEATPQSRMRLLAAGSYVNMVFALIAMLLIANFAALMSIGFNPPSGAYIYDIDPNSPAADALQVGDVIIGLNDTEIENWANVSQFMSHAIAGSSLTIVTLRHGSVNITLAAHELNATRGYIGIYGTDYWEPKPGWEWIPGGPMFAFHVRLTLMWTFMILFSVALFNLLPIPAFDGDKLLSNALGLVMKDERRVRQIMWPLRGLAIALILLNIGLSLWFGKGLF